MNSPLCPECNDRGLIIIDNNNVHICKCADKIKTAGLAEYSHMTASLRQKNFENFNLDYYSKTIKDPLIGKTHQEIAAISLKNCSMFVKDYLEGKNPQGLYIFGQVGSGKTHLACSIANQLIKSGIEVLFIVVPDYIDDIKFSWDESTSYREKEILDQGREATILIMDDLGAHSYSDWTKSKIYSILNHRINTGLPTIITSNLNFQDIEKYLDTRISSRIIELCRPLMLQVDKNEDIRLKKSTEKTFLKK